MKHGEKVTPVAAAFSAAATLLCCLPVGFAAAAATAGLGAVVLEYRPWFLGASVLLLMIGALQVRRAHRLCRTRPTGSIVILSVCGAIVLSVIFFPQMIASLLADLLP
jgi:hypothetical protein